ncbi:hypothetical protein RR48_07357 [Papilio machaon]|uniref:Uncharacterized protein n=1 Tax=Papilio machaon TaxID=76193 RepID=A0A194RKV6_PAPMA|nr:hypothetical protein RR48_07357 [Papilio machaon]
MAIATDIRARPTDSFSDDSVKGEESNAMIYAIPILQTNKMRVTLKFISLFFYFNYFPQVLTNYIYDEIENVASFLPSTREDIPYPRPKLNGHKKYFITNGNPKFQKLMNERSVDTHFRVVKTGFTNPIISNINGEEIRNVQKFTVPANLREEIIKDAVNTKHLLSHENLFPEDNKNISATKKPTTDILEESVYRNTNGKMYDRKDNYITSYSESQNIININQRSRNSPSGKRLSGFTHKIQPQLKINKAIQKSTTNDENSPTIRRVYDKGGKLTDKIQQKTGRKRDTNVNEETDLYGKKNKYYTGLDNVISLKRMPIEQGLMEHIADENIDVTNSPYAVFYRMSPDIIDQQDGYMVMNAQDERTNSLYKDREATMNSENQIENSKSNYRKYSNSGRVHGKVKNFSNFRNFK